MDAAYNIHDSPLGTVRVSLQKPVANITLHDEPFCPNNPNYAETWGKFPQERALPSMKEHPPIACQVWDEHGVKFPADELNTAFITTRVAVESQKYNCGQENTNYNATTELICDSPYKTIPESTGYYFLGGVRNFTLGIQHNFYPQSPIFKAEQFTGNSRSVYGSISPAGWKGKKPWKEFPVADSKQNSETPDIITVGELLDAGKIDFSAPSKNVNNSVYYSGVVVLVMIKYQNEHYHPKRVTYEYTVKAIRDSDYKLFETRQRSMVDSDGRSYQVRDVIKRAGVKFIFVVNGDFMKFDFQTFLLQCVAALGLLSISTYIVEALMLYCMKWRQFYRSAKYEQTTDFASFYQNNPENDEISVDPHQSNNNNNAQYAEF